MNKKRGDTFRLQGELSVLAVSISSDEKSTPRGDTAYEFIEEAQIVFTPLITEILVLTGKADTHKVDTPTFKNLFVNRPMMLNVELTSVQLCNRIRASMLTLTEYWYASRRWMVPHKGTYQQHF